MLGFTGASTAFNRLLIGYFLPDNCQIHVAEDVLSTGAKKDYNMNIRMSAGIILPAIGHFYLALTGIILTYYF